MRISPSDPVVSKCLRAAVVEYGDLNAKVITLGFAWQPLVVIEGSLDDATVYEGLAALANTVCWRALLYLGPGSERRSVYVLDVAGGEVYSLIYSENRKGSKVARWVRVTSEVEAKMKEMSFW